MHVRTDIPEDHCSSFGPARSRIVLCLFIPRTVRTPPPPPHEQCLSRARGPDRKGDLPAISEGSIVRSPIVTGISRGRARSRQWETIGKSYVCVICISRVARKHFLAYRGFPDRDFPGVTYPKLSYIIGRKRVIFF